MVDALAGGKVSRRILVVDDDRACCTALQMLLRDEGFDVEIAPGGEAALASIHRAPPDVLLSDIRMPGMDGFALLRAARAAKPDLLVVLMSAEGAAESEVLGAGADGYVVKPLDVDLVVRAIEGALARGRAGG